MFSVSMDRHFTADLIFTYSLWIDFCLSDSVTTLLNPKFDLTYKIRQFILVLDVIEKDFLVEVLCISIINCIQPQFMLN